MLYQSCRQAAYKFILGSLIALTSTLTTLQSIDIRDYQGSYTCFRQDKKHLSALHGVTTYEWLIQGIYFVAPQGVETATMKLCKQLFHSVDNRIQFNVTLSQRQPAYHFSPQIIAKLLNTLEEHRERPTLNRDILQQNLIQTIETDQNYQRSISATQTLCNQSLDKMQPKMNKLTDIIEKSSNIIASSTHTLGLLLPKLSNAIASSEITSVIVPKKASKFTISWAKECLTHLNPQTDNVLIQLVTTLLTTKETKNKAQSNKKAAQAKLVLLKKAKSCYAYDPASLENFINILIDACHESALLGNKAPLYSTYTPYRLLQAFLYRKFTNFEELTEYNNEMSQHFLNNPTEPISSQDKDYENSIIERFKSDTLPSLDDDRTIDYFAPITPDKTCNESFTDCTENTLRHLFSLLCYDPTAKKFNVELLQKFAAPGKQVSPELLNYFKKFTTPADANRCSLDHELDRLDGHQHWANIISNVKGLIYAQYHHLNKPAAKRNTVLFSVQASTLPDSTENDIIKIDDINVRPLNQEAYHLFELDASLRNIIIACNYLLNLDLFDMNNKAFLIQQEYVKEDPKQGPLLKPGYLSKYFVDTYWTELCQRLGWIVTSKTIKKHDLHFAITHHYDNQLPVCFGLTISPHLHAKVQSLSRPHQEIPTSPLVITSSEDLLQKVFLQDASPENIVRILATLNTTGPHHQNLLTEACCAYYQAVINDETLCDNLEAYFQTIEVLHDVNPALAYTMQHLLHFDENIFLNALVHQSPECIQKIRAQFTTIGCSYLNAIKKTTNPDVLAEMLANNNQAFDDTEQQAALANSLCYSSYALRGLLCNEKLLKQKNIISKIKSVKEKNPDLFLDALITLHRQALIVFRQMCSHAEWSYTNLFATTHKINVLSAILENSSHQFNPDELKAALQNPLTYTTQAFAKLLCNEQLIKQANVIVSVRQTCTDNPNLFFEALLTLNRQKRTTLKKYINTTEWTYARFLRKITHRPLLEKLFHHYFTRTDEWNDEEVQALLAHQNTSIELIITHLKKSLLLNLPQEQTMLADKLTTFVNQQNSTELFTDIALIIKNSTNIQDNFLHVLLTLTRYNATYLIDALAQIQDTQEKKRIINLLPADQSGLITQFYNEINEKSDTNYQQYFINHIRNLAPLLPAAWIIPTAQQQENSLAQPQ